VARTTGVPVHRLPPPPYDWARTLAVVRERSTVPVRPNAALHRVFIDRAAGGGRPVVLTGEGGDEWLGYPWRFWPERLRRGQADLVVRAARAWVEDRRVPALRAAQLVARRGLRPLLEEGGARPTDPLPRAVPPWIDAAAAARLQLGERILRPAATDRRGPVFPARFAQELGGIEIEAANAGVDYRHPFHDRRLVELTFAVPEELLRRGGTTKWLLREAMAGVLPEEVRRRTGKGHFDPYVHRGVHAVLDGLGGIEGLDRLLGVRHGLLDRDGLRTLAERSLACVRQGRTAAEPTENVNNLWAVLAADLWLAVHTGEPVPMLPAESVLT
jgi:asparagine synthase (glutamine-hydrolysing)